MQKCSLPNCQSCGLIDSRSVSDTLEEDSADGLMAVLGLQGLSDQSCMRCVPGYSIDNHQNCIKTFEGCEQYDTEQKLCAQCSFGWYMNGELKCLKVEISHLVNSQSKDYVKVVFPILMIVLAAAFLGIFVYKLLSQKKKRLIHYVTEDTDFLKIE